MPRLRHACHSSCRKALHTESDGIPGHRHVLYTGEHAHVEDMRGLSACERAPARERLSAKCRRAAGVHPHMSTRPLLQPAGGEGDGQRGTPAVASADSLATLLTRAGYLPGAMALSPPMRSLWSEKPAGVYVWRERLAGHPTVSGPSDVVEEAFSRKRQR